MRLEPCWDVVLRVLNPVMLYWAGGVSVIMLYPAKKPLNISLRPDPLVYVQTTSSVAEQPHVKGQHANVRSGKPTNFVGIDSRYEPPECPEFYICTTTMSVGDAAAKVVRIFWE